MSWSFRIAFLVALFSLLVCKSDIWVSYHINFYTNYLETSELMILIFTESPILKIDIFFLLIQSLPEGYFWARNGHFHRNSSRTQKTNDSDGTKNAELVHFIGRYRLYRTAMVL